MKQLKDLKEEILNNKFHNFYIFYGEDFGLRKHYIDAIKKKFNRVVILDTHEELSENKGTASLFETHTFYIIYNDILLNKLTSDQINMLIKKINNDCVVFDFDEISESSILIKEFGNFVTYFPLVDDKIGLEFVDSELSLTLKSKELLSYNCFNNYSMILMEADKIKMLSEAKNESQEQAFEDLNVNKQLITRVENYNNDDIVNTLLTNNTNMFAYYNKLIVEHYSQDFWYNLYKTVNDFIVAYFIKKLGKYPGGSKAYELGFSWNRIKAIRELKIAFDADTLLYYIYELADLDYKVKTGKILQDSIFNYIVYTIF